MHVATKKEAFLSGGSLSIKNFATSAYSISMRKSGKEGLSQSDTAKMTRMGNRSPMNKIVSELLEPIEIIDIDGGESTQYR